ncbi:MAG: enoyl-CoA hydratase-related protein [Bacteroidota bacterium]|nr:enoyl-CoA hydratase-related protein [Bacteroidota bacterium]MDP4233983.1 enoyl-CoA hydratase-related protein [Bacteroidota bacterium]MDP4242850.1 enoyl-CoA hydratase-related protein [Bacteroidota bacterium]MDP4287712.1 enoyl-CoA hydratase-related protein [Bacteroidota bacterium]
MAETILTKLDSGIFTITLNRPEVYNAFNEQLTTDLQDAFKEAAKNDAVRVVILTGAGKAFCSGQDLKDAPTGNSANGTGKRSLRDSLERRYNPLIRAMRKLPKPIIASINGVAAGAGASLALACDYRIMADNAKLIEVFVRIGLVPDSGSSWFLVKMLGVAKAFELAALGDDVPAQKALELSLANQVVPAADLERETLKIAERFATGPTKAYGYIKHMMDRAAAVSLDDALDYEVFMQEAAGRTEDYANAVKAFADKRKPEYTGR